MQKEMDGKRVELEKLRDEMEKKGALLTADARREKQEQFERKRRDAARLADDFQKELEKKESGLLQKVLQDVSGVIERVGKEKNYYLIVEKRGGGILYGAAEADLTDEVIRAVRPRGSQGRRRRSRSGDGQGRVHARRARGSRSRRASMAIRAGLSLGWRRWRAPGPTRSRS